MKSESGIVTLDGIAAPTSYDLTSSSTLRVDATGTLASVDASSGTDPVAALDAIDVSVVWTPSAASG